MMDDPGHIPVLANEVMDLLAPQPGDVVVDATLGRGGHALLMAQAIAPDGHLLGFDLDASNLDFAAARLEATTARISRVHGSFERITEELTTRNLTADVLLADLGYASNQVDDPDRGFSFRHDGPLDMRLDPGGPITAADLVAQSSEADLADLIFQYGEEPLARRIARKLVQNRGIQPIQSTAELARLVIEAYGRRARTSRLHPATRTFMALRIAVNDELGALTRLLDSITRCVEQPPEQRWLAADARVGIISFHSLEDRLVKRAFADLAARSLASSRTKKPLTASDEEARRNPRARSAKLRVIRLTNPVGEGLPSD
jgi:16S rRNA (cytosine1402-N4)-methyltransferase